MNIFLDVIKSTLILASSNRERKQTRKKSNKIGNKQVSMKARNQASKLEGKRCLGFNGHLNTITLL